MGKLDKNWVYNNHEIYEDFNDIIGRNYVIVAALDILGRKLISHPNPKGIDLMDENDHTVLVEVERGKHIGDLWKSPQCRKSKLSEGTVNFPHRKEKYYHDFYEYTDENGIKIEVDNREYKNKIIFVRSNWDGSQLVFIFAEAVHNGNFNKIKFIPDNNVKKKPETFLCFRKKHSRTFNKQLNGKFMEDNTPYGQYVTLSDYERRFQEAEVDLDRKRLKLKAAMEEYELAKKNLLLETKNKELRLVLGRRLNKVERRNIGISTIPMFPSNCFDMDEQDRYGIPRYELQQEEYFKKHPKLGK